MSIGGGFGGNSSIQQLISSGSLQQLINKGQLGGGNSSLFVPYDQSHNVNTGYNGQYSVPQSGQQSGYNGQYSVPQSPSLPPEPLTPIQQLQQQLQQQLAGLSINSFLTPQDVINKQASGAVNAQYDPQISGLLTNIAQQKTTTKQNQGKATQMYDALAQDLASQIPAMQQQTKQQQGDANSMYGSAKQDIGNQYANQNAQQQDTLKQLGLQAAMGNGSSGNAAVAANSPTGGVGQQAANDEKYAQSQADLQNQQAQNLLGEQGASSVQYQNSMADNSRMTGSNVVEDLSQQLANYLTGANSQVTALKSSKAQALQSMIAQLEQANQQNAQQQYQNSFNNTMATNNFGLSALKEQDSNTNAANSLAQQLALAQQKANPGLTSGPTGAASYLAKQYQNNPNEAVVLNQLIQDTLSRPDVINGVHNVNGSNASNTEAYLIDQLRQQAASEGVTNQSDLNNAINALLAFNGKLK
jgi:hypothetical protein